MSPRARWTLVIGVAGLFIAGCAWLVWTNAPIYQFIVRLYVDKLFLKKTLREWGVSVIEPVDAGDGPRMVPVQAILSECGLRLSQR